MFPEIGNSGKRERQTFIANFVPVERSTTRRTAANWPVPRTCWISYFPCGPPSAISRCSWMRSRKVKVMNSTLFFGFRMETSVPFSIKICVFLAMRSPFTKVPFVEVSLTKKIQSSGPPEMLLSRHT